MSVSTPIRRVVDAHVHHWDPARVEWYPFLASDDALAALGMDDVSAMRRPFDRSTYLAESHAWHVEKYVHVTATAAGDYFLAETAEREREAQRDGQPNAIIGGLQPQLDRAELVAQLETQQRASRFRGIRVSDGMDYASPRARTILNALQESGLVYDLVVHPEHMLDTARALEPFGSLTVVVEHTGWPLSEDDAHVRQWREGMTALAGLSDDVHCKISGLAMTLNRFDVGAFRPWVEHCLDTFGERRCFFASNFPVDGLFGSFDQLYQVYDELTSALDDSARDALFAGNAERVYRC